MDFPMTPSVGIIIYLSPPKIHRAVLCLWLGGDAGESRSFASLRMTNCRFRKGSRKIQLGQGCGIPPLRLRSGAGSHVEKHDVRMGRRKLDRWIDWALSHPARGPCKRRRKKRALENKQPFSTFARARRLRRDVRIEESWSMFSGRIDGWWNDPPPGISAR